MNLREGWGERKVGQKAERTVRWIKLVADHVVWRVKGKYKKDEYLHKITLAAKVQLFRSFINLFVTTSHCNSKIML